MGVNRDGGTFGAGMKRRKRREREKGMERGKWSHGGKGRERREGQRERRKAEGDEGTGICPFHSLRRIEASELQFQSSRRLTKFQQRTSTA